MLYNYVIMKDMRNGGKNNFTKSVFGRLLKSSVSIVVLTAFVLGIAFSIKQLSELNSKSFITFVSPYLSKIGIEEEMVGDVAGILFRNNRIDESPQISTQPNVSETVVDVTPQGLPIYTAAIFADIHLANDKDEYIENKSHLRIALDKALELKVDNLLVVGDLTNWGVLEDLREAKKILDDSQIPYYAIPGDRDLAQSVGVENFIQVFNKDKYVFEKEGYKFLILNNSANYTEIPEDTMLWFKEEVVDSDFVILSQPLYTEGLIMFNYLYMGNTGNTEDANLVERQKLVKDQRDIILSEIRNSNVKAVLAGDHHKSSQVSDKEKSELAHYVVGAISGTVSEYAQSVIQSQRFAVLKIYDNGTFVVEDIIL